MLFNTIDFVFFFVTVLLVIGIIRNRKFQHLFLIAASYFFFYYSSNYLIMLLLYTTLWDFYFGKEIWKSTSIRRKKILLVTSLAGNLGLLGFYKYSDFTITQLNLLGNYFGFTSHISLLNLALPIGISFYTFHSITYTVGIYRRDLIPEKSLIDYAIFVAFFPQLVAGPILRAKEFLPQLKENVMNSQAVIKFRQIVIQSSNLKLGLTIMAIGFLKKMLIADNVAPLVDQVFLSPIGWESFTIVLGTIGFGIQILADFSGYTDIAIGAATILGFKIPINFNLPYFAKSPSDFWRRWHISLSTWLRDYLYIPLGGNKKSQARTHVNIFIVMFLGGLWHGASWNFVIWGILHGVYLSIQKAVLQKFPLMNHPFLRRKLGIILSTLVTQYFIFLAWIPFRVTDFNNIIYCMQKFILWDFETKSTSTIVSTNVLPIIFIVLFILLEFIVLKKTNMKENIANLRLPFWTVFMASVMILILFFYDVHPRNFIYFQF